MERQQKRYELPVRKVSVVEVCPRDGLQIEPHFISTDDKITLANMLTDAGCAMVELTSFVHPKWVPQMADAEKVIAGVKKGPGSLYNALVPNKRGLARALECGLDAVVTIISASESHNRKNLNMSVDASLRELEAVIGQA